MLVIPKTLAQNGGYDSQEVIVNLLSEAGNTGMTVGMDCATGEPVVPYDLGIGEIKETFNSLKVKERVFDRLKPRDFIRLKPRAFSLCCSGQLLREETDDQFLHRHRLQPPPRRRNHAGRPFIPQRSIKREIWPHGQLII